MIVRGQTNQLLVSTIDKASDEPKADVTAASISVYGYDALGIGHEVIINAPATEIATGFCRYSWFVPADFEYNDVRLFWNLTDSGGNVGSVSSDDTVLTKSSTYQQLDTVQAMVEFIMSMDGGRWIIDENTGVMSFYGVDNSTLIAEFQLYDREGNITNIPGLAYERKRI